MYEMLVGYPPFYAEDPMQMCHKIVRCARAPRRAWGPMGGKESQGKKVGHETIGKRSVAKA